MPDANNVNSVVNFNRQSTLSTPATSQIRTTAVTLLANSSARLSLPPQLMPARVLSRATSLSLPLLSSRSNVVNQFTRSIRTISPVTIPTLQRPSPVLAMDCSRDMNNKKQRITGDWGVKGILQSTDNIKNAIKEKKFIRKNAAQQLAKLSLNKHESNQVEQIKQDILRNIRQPGKWNHQAIDIAVAALANAFNLHLNIYDADLGFSVNIGQSPTPQKTINLQRIRVHDQEHYQFIDDSGVVRDVAADGNCLFTTVSIGLYGDEDSWGHLRNETASHINEYWDDYKEFIEQPSEDTSLNERLSELTESKPHIKDNILDITARMLKENLYSFIGRYVTPVQVIAKADEVTLRNVLHHFLSIYDVKKLAEIKQAITRWQLDPVEEKRQLGRLQTLAERSQHNLRCLEFREQAGQQKHKDVNSLKIFATAISNDLVSIMVGTGINPHQLLAFLEATEAANLLQDAGLLGATCEDLADILQGTAEDPDLPAEYMRIKEYSVQRQIEQLKEDFEESLVALAQFDQDIDADGFFIMSDRQLDDNYSPENYNHTDKLDDVVSREGVNKKDVIAHRSRRLLEKLFMQRVAVNHLFEDVIYNGPLFMVRSVINPEQREVYYDGEISEKSVRHHLNNNRAARLASLKQYMTGAPFILGEGEPVKDMNLDGLNYGDKGLSIETLNRELIDNPTVSIFRLNRIGLWSNTVISKITQTGVMDFHWMDELKDDTVEALFQGVRNPGNNDELDSLLLFSSLMRIGKIIKGDEFDEHQIAGLIEEGLEPFTLGKLSLTLDELAHLLFLLPYGVDGGRGIIDIATKIDEECAEGEVPYSPVADWKMLVTLLADKTRFRERLQLRLQVLQEKIDHIPLPAFCRYLARQGNMIVIEEDESQEFLAYYEPTGQVVFTPPAEQPDQPFMVLRPDSLEVYDGREAEPIEFSRFEQTNFSALRAIIETEAIRFANIRMRKPTDAENREALEQFALNILAHHKG
ncbi:OTU domain-containing protein [Pantoea sp. App145]|uniref:OTU domain-containing protein n=1 Tax=Pantoea sp. App145 TaxID=3071567 RepID=UPI003A7F9788